MSSCLQTCDDLCLGVPSKFTYIICVTPTIYEVSQEPTHFPEFAPIELMSMLVYLL